MYSIEISFKQLIELLTIHNTLNGISLVNHNWLAIRLKEYTSEHLYENGIVLETLSNGTTDFYAVEGWKEELRRRKSIDDITKSREIFNKLENGVKGDDIAIESIEITLTPAQKLLSKMLRNLGVNDEGIKQALTQMPV